MLKLYFKDGDFIEPADSIYYLLAQDGLYQVKRNACFRAAFKVNGLASLREHREEVEFLLPKIPAFLMEEVIGFFRRVNSRLQSEAVALLYYSSETGQYRVMVPVQYVDDSECDYEIGHTPLGWLLVGTIHSHCRGPAYHSLADDLDEGEMEGLHITVGDLNRRLSFSCSLVVDCQRAPLEPQDVLEGYPDLGQQRKGFRFVDQWMGSVQRKSPALDDMPIEAMGIMETPPI